MTGGGRRTPRVATARRAPGVPDLRFGTLVQRAGETGRARSPARSRMVRAIRRLAASIMRPSCVAAPWPAATAASKASHQRGGGRDLAFARREQGVGGGELAGMDALLAVEPHRAGDAARALEAGGVLVRGVRTVETAQSVGPRRGHDAVHGRVPAVPRVELVVGVELADARRRHPHRRRVVPGAEDEGVEPRRRRRDLPQVDVAQGALDLGLDADGAAEASMGLDLRQQHLHEHHVARGGRLGQHHQVDAIARAFDDVHQIPVGVGRVGSVDTDNAQAVAEVERAQGVHRVRAGGGLLGRDDGVLEIEAHRVGGARRGLRHHVRPRRRHEQHAADEAGRRRAHRWLMACAPWRPLRRARSTAGCASRSSLRGRRIRTAPPRDRPW